MEQTKRSMGNAHPAGIEPTSSVLETDVLPLNHGHKERGPDGGDNT